MRKKTGRMYWQAAAAGLLAAGLGVQGAEPAALPAFPGAEGYGALATGGRGGEIYHVTTLEDSGPGSLRDAVSKGPRIVVFDVGGTIKLKANLPVSSDITVLGQTAPGEGVCIYNKTMSVSNSHNIILRYLRLRQGINGDRGKCSLNASGVKNLMVDHVSIEWGRWDNLGLTEGAETITLQYCLIGESIDPQRFGALIDSANNVTLSHNLWMHNQSRNPKAKGTIQYINNVVYNWGVTGLVGGHSGAEHSLDMINNYFIKGPNSNNRYAGQFTGTDQVFHSGNLVDLDRDGKLNGRPAEEPEFGEEKDAPTFVKTGWSKPPVPPTVDTAEAAFQKVIAGVGASLHRDAVDRRLVNDVLSFGTKGQISKSEADIGGLPEIKGGELPQDSDHDGMPDEWEKAKGLNPKDASDGAKLNAAGYTNIEAYANSLVK